MADPAAGFPRSADLRAGNPVLNDNRMRLGVFGLNSIGVALTLAPEAHQASWAGSLAAAAVADEAGFEAIVPYARWRSSVADVHHRSSQVMECFVWAAALAARTSYSAIFATCQVPVFHPVLAAKQAATIDQISGGRFGLNIVAGQRGGELGMFGAELADHAGRYEQAAEWTEVLQRMWSEPEPFDHRGRFYTVLGGYLEPKPAQAPWPVIMNAGSSGRGRAFAAQHSDATFVMFTNDRLEHVREEVERYRTLAREEFGREIQVWTPGYVVQGDTDAEAQAAVRRLVELGDYEYADAWVETLQQTASFPDDVVRQLKLDMVAGGGGLPFVGSAETIARRLEAFADAGLDGVLLGWIEYEQGIRRFAAEVIPLLEARGLRAPKPR
jgi:alkanesulfonate monooxygenase SsuD/methylene tetrahydromethanopterin reductase-like flavin-dependent oxidoreductase (luciferase family)